MPAILDRKMIWVPCEACEGTGHMSNDRAWEILQRDGVRPNQYFGCDTCDGMGEVEADEEGMAV